MNKQRSIKCLLLLGYSIPYAFLGMYGDAAFHTVSLYLPWLIFFPLLYIIACKTRNTGVIWAGNLLSFVSSYIFTIFCGLENRSFHFKPFTPLGFLKLTTCTAVLAQLMILLARLSRRQKAV